MCELTSAFTAFAQSVRGDLLGIAPIERFANAPRDMHPASLFPAARSVVVVGTRIPVTLPAGKTSVDEIAAACAAKDPVMKHCTCTLEPCLRHCPAERQSAQRLGALEGRA